MKTTKIEDRKFACVAEAVAHFHKQGFVTFDDTQDRIMRNGNLKVLIRKVGFLNVEASVISLA